MHRHCEVVIYNKYRNDPPPQKNTRGQILAPRSDAMWPLALASAMWLTATIVTQQPYFYNLRVHENLKLI